MQYFIGFIVGAILGGLTVYTAVRHYKKNAETSFSALSLEALRKNSEEFLRLANQTLSAQAQSGVGDLAEKKRLIDQTLEGIKAEMSRVERVMVDFDGRRAKESGEINAKLQTTAEQTNKLQEVTNKLELALANSRERGQWGERMAEDILRLVGLMENVNYTKQKTQEGRGTRPDFTFMLPQNMKVNMDVKFPWENYRNFLNTELASDKESYKQKFIADTRQKIKEVKSRDYINQEEGTVDYAILFIPNEQVFCFLNECDPSILDDALRERVILSSPITLFAILCVIRQAVHNFNLEQTSDHILSLFGTFFRQWGEFQKAMDKMGERIKQADQEFERLSSTRTRALERPLREIENLRRQRGIPESGLVDDQRALASQTDTNELTTVDDPPNEEARD
jgi:DNA recombination protein RmuC